MHDEVEVVFEGDNRDCAPSDVEEAKEAESDVAGTTDTAAEGKGDASADEKATKSTATGHAHGRWKRAVSCSVAGVVKLTHVPRDRVLVEWTGSPLADMIADSLITLVAQTETSAFTVKGMYTEERLMPLPAPSNQSQRITRLNHTTHTAFVACALAPNASNTGTCSLLRSEQPHRCLALTDTTLANGNIATAMMPLMAVATMPSTRHRAAWRLRQRWCGGCCKAASGP